VGLHFDRPWLLLLLVPAALWLYWAWRSTLRLSGRRRGIAFTVRALIALLLIAAASGMSPTMRGDYRAVVFVADRSASVADDARIARWIGEAIAGKDEGDRAGVVSVGRTAAVERPLTHEGGAPALRADLDPDFTNLTDGLRLAASMLPDGGRIVLLSDGRNNTGDAIRQSRLLRARGIAVDIVPLAGRTAADAAVESLVVPAAVKLGERFTIELEVAATLEGEAEIRLFENEREIARETVRLTPGMSRYLLQNIAAEAGMNRYRAEVYMPGDERPQNDAAYGFSRVEGPPRVLVVEGEPGSSGNIVSALEASLMPYDLIAPEQLSVELADYARYDAILLNNVPATRLSRAVMDRLASAVGDLGIGLLVAGGEDSFGLGGYYDTPLERALPVYMDLKGRRQMPSLGLILVIDRSGSMDGGKLELAKEAALRAIGLLRDEDTVGVVAFDDAPWWVVEPTRLTDRKAVEEAVLGIQPAGGTDIYPAVYAALDRMLDIEAQRRHIILLTDGMSAGGGNYSALTKAMNDEGITMSTVAVGNDADTALLKRLADMAKGRYYFTADQSTIPAIFSRETAMMARTYIVENRFVPAIGQAGGWLPLFSSGVPAVDAYVATTAKETAETALLSPEGDPLLARWSYGAGRAVAWTSDLAGKWSADWVGWAQFPEALAAWVKWTFPQFSTDPWHVQARLDGGDAELTITAQGESGTANLEATATGEDGNAVKLRPIPVAPGEYTVRLEDAKPGVYFMQISGGEGADGESPGGSLAGFVIPYSPEFRPADDDEGLELLGEIARLTGGRTLSPDHPEEVFRTGRIASSDRVDLTRELLIAALLLWLIDIAVRRLSLPWRRIADALAARLSVRRGSDASAAGAPASLSRLRRRTQEAGEFYAHAGAILREQGARKVPGAEPEAGPRPATGPASTRPDAGGMHGPRPGAPDPPAIRADAPEPSAARPDAIVPNTPGPDGAGSAMERLLAAKRRGSRR